MRRWAFRLAPFFILVSYSNEAAPPGFRIDSVRIEHLESPLGLDKPAPRFAWKLQSERRGQKQSAYRIVVSRSGTTVWDRSKVSSSDTTLVPYEGTPLEARARYQVAIEPWNRDGSASARAESFWETGTSRASAGGGSAFRPRILRARRSRQRPGSSALSATGSRSYS